MHLRGTAYPGRLSGSAFGDRRTCWVHRRQTRGENGRHDAGPVFQGTYRLTPAILDDAALACLAGGGAQYECTYARCSTYRPPGGYIGRRQSENICTGRSSLRVGVQTYQYSTKGPGLGIGADFEKSKAPTELLCRGFCKPPPLVSRERASTLYSRCWSSFLCVKLSSN